MMLVMVNGTRLSLAYATTEAAAKPRKATVVRNFSSGGMSASGSHHQGSATPALRGWLGRFLPCLVRLLVAAGLFAEGQPQIVVQTPHRGPVQSDDRECQGTVDSTNGHEHRHGNARGHI